MVYSNNSIFKYCPRQLFISKILNIFLQIYYLCYRSMSPTPDESEELEEKMDYKQNDGKF
jgi:hypothetical protein